MAMAATAAWARDATRLDPASSKVFLFLFYYRDTNV
jgi:hypothetical protein